MFEDFYLRIGDVSGILGMPVTTIRYWALQNILYWTAGMSRTKFFSKAQIDLIAEKLPYGRVRINDLKKLIKDNYERHHNAA